MRCTLGPLCTRVGALLLAVVATFGVAMPRARVTARERVGRAVAIRLGSPRINDRLGWVAPDPRRTSSLAAPSPAATELRDLLVAHPAETFRVSVVPAGQPETRRETRPVVVPASAGHRFRTFGRPPPHA